MKKIEIKSLQITNGTFDTNLDGWTIEQYRYIPDSDAIWDNGRARLRTFQCGHVEVSQSFIIGPSISFDYETVAELNPADISVDLIVDGVAVINLLLKAGVVGWVVSEHVYIDTSMYEGKTGILKFSITPTEYCGYMYYFANTYLWIDNVKILPKCQTITLNVSPTSVTQGYETSLIATSNPNIEGYNVDFFVNNNIVGTSSTDPDGIATFGLNTGFLSINKHNITASIGTQCLSSEIQIEIIPRPPPCQVINLCICPSSIEQGGSILLTATIQEIPEIRVDSPISLSPQIYIVDFKVDGNVVTTVQTDISRVAKYSLNTRDLSIGSHEVEASVGIECSDTKSIEVLPSKPSYWPLYALAGLAGLWFITRKKCTDLKTKEECEKSPDCIWINGKCVEKK